MPRSFRRVTLEYTLSWNKPNIEPMKFAYAQNMRDAGTNKTLSPCKHDYDSFFKRMTPKHTLLWNKPNTEPMGVRVCRKHEKRQNKQNTEPMKSMPRSLSVWTQNIRLYESNRTQLMQIWVCPKHDGARNKQNTKTMQISDYASFFKRVTQKHSLLAKCKFAISCVIF